MSITITKAKTALLQGVVESLQESIGDSSELRYLQSRSIQITVDERASPSTARTFIGVYLSNVGRETLGPTRKEIYQIIVALTMRKVGIPADMRGVDLYTDTYQNRAISMTEIMEAIIETIDGKYDVIEKINSYIKTDGEFAGQPMFLQPNADLTPREVGPEHFRIQPSEKGVKRSVETFEAYLIQIPFSNAVRFVNTLPS
jgi:hypothetical protein